MKNAAVLIVALLSLSGLLVASDAEARPALSLKVTHDYYIVKDTPGKANYPVTRLEYSISDIANVRAAWIEFLNRPTVVEKKSIAVQKSGELLWDYRDSHVQTDVPSGQLGISIRDPQAWTMGEEEGPVKGYETDPVVIGHTDEYDPARLDSEPALQVMAGSGDVWVTLHGDNLTPLTRFHVSVAEGKSGYCPDQKITARALSMREVRVLIPAQCTEKPGQLGVATLEDSPSEGAVIYVARPDGPILKSLNPDSLPSDASEKREAIVVLRGRNFTRESTVHGGTSPYFSYNFKTQYVSPRELRAVMPGGGIMEVRHLEDMPLQLWVVGEGDYQLSEPRAINILPPVNGREYAKRAYISDISPYSVRLMDEKSPKEIKLTIRGRNFRNDDLVVARNFPRCEQVLRTEYVSPTVMRAWLPREFWRKPRVAYRLVVETVSGEKYSRQLNDDELDD